MLSMWSRRSIPAAGYPSSSPLVAARKIADSQQPALLKPRKCYLDNFSPNMTIPYCWPSGLPTPPLLPCRARSGQNSQPLGLSRIESLASIAQLLMIRVSRIQGPGIRRPPPAPLSQSCLQSVEDDFTNEGKQYQAGTSLHFKAGNAHGPHSTKNGCRLLILWTERTSSEADLSDFALTAKAAA